jgi:hypothetical protein
MQQCFAACAGLDGCSQLQQLHITRCGVQQLSACRVLRQITELRLQYNEVDLPILALSLRICRSLQLSTSATTKRGQALCSHYLEAST